jgi:prophage regulatory protein
MGKLIRRLMRMGAVCDETGLSPSWTWELVARGDFPAPVKIGKVSAFVADEVAAWIEKRIAERPATFAKSAKSQKLAEKSVAKRRERAAQKLAAKQQSDLKLVKG